ncbi:efflux RND transporter periplasmic adaptor subunit [Massilia sp. Root335]|uniref:efflux RND transporter periplasmic adaptor subunit n=1 Tax=Massilia sp. Root335 TaxID=1736517 RepID=UPI0009EC8458|nr:efflux RND transporter periplasmic adaptor subunit [Massilia sp. Root335]
MNSASTNKYWRQIREHWRAILGPVIAASVVFGLVLYFSVRATPLSAPSTVTVERTDIVQIVQASGLLQPKLRVDIGAQVSGQVRQLHVQLGQTVKTGALLVSLDSDSGRNAVQQAEAAMAQQAATVKRTRIDLEAVRREAERQRRLLAGDATTILDKEKADTDLSKLEAELQVQEAMLQQRRADLVDKQLKLTFTRVSAPIDGEVVAVAVQEGQTVNALQMAPTLLTLAQMRTMTVKARVAEAEIGLVRVGQTAHVTTLAANGQRYEGKVRVVQPIPERIGNALFYNVLFDIDNTDHQLLSDMTVQVELDVARADQVPTLPVLALDKRGNDGRYTVQVLDATGKINPRQVRIGIRDDAHAQVLEGVKPGERVLLTLPAATPSTTVH